MKKITKLLLLLLVIFSLVSTALAEGQTFANVSELIEYWEENGYPDYISSIFSTSDSQDSITIMLVEGYETSEMDLREMITDRSNVVITGGGKYKYSYMRTVCDEIYAEYISGGDGSVSSCTIGWYTSSEGTLTGFGDNGMDSRVVVEVSDDQAQHYADVLYKEYGGAVAVCASGKIIVSQSQLEDDETSSKPTRDWSFYLLFIIGIVFICTGLRFGLRPKRSKEERRAHAQKLLNEIPLVSTKEIENSIAESIPVKITDFYGEILSRIDIDT